MTYASKYLQSDPNKKSSTLNEPQKIALRQDFDDGELLCRTAGCLGRWVLLSASRHTEAGELHTLGGRPKETHLGAFPWKIQVHETGQETPDAAAIVEEKKPAPPDTMEQIQKALNFQYPHLAATVAPSKQTATGRKGRFKDEEAAQDTRQPKNLVRPWRQPGFRGAQAEGKTYGNAIHAALQYLCYERCGSLRDVEHEIHRLVEEKFLTQEQGAMVDCERLARFFQTEPGQKLRSGTPYLREFKFSILDDGSHYGDGLEGEKVLLQGVVDCALLEEDGITIIDFKTDRVSQQTVLDAAQRYRPQVETYAEALHRIYQMPVKAKLLYFFHIDRFIEL